MMGSKQEAEKIPRNKKIINPPEYKVIHPPHNKGEAAKPPKEKEKK